MLKKDSLSKTRHQRFVTLCGRIFHDSDPRYFPRTEYRGRTIYLCTEACLNAFLADPHVFYKTHRNSEKKNGWKADRFKR
ncbi:MAG: hypothetical protein HYX49_00285 [Chloroflexi bacterium]|nr:hypothetical protein [Chloroflexota bacterium]